MARGGSLKELKNGITQTKNCWPHQDDSFPDPSLGIAIGKPPKMNLLIRKGQNEILSDTLGDMFTALEANPSPPQTKALKFLILCSCGRNALYQKQAPVPQAKDK